MKNLEILQLPKCDRDNEVIKCCWKNGAKKLAQCRVATNLQFIKKNKTISVKHNKAKCNKMRYACIYIYKDSQKCSTSVPNYKCLKETCKVLSYFISWGYA